MHSIWLLKPHSSSPVIDLFPSPTPNAPNWGLRIQMPKIMGPSHSSYHRNGMVYLISVFSFSLLIYRQTVDFVYIKPVSYIFAAIGDYC